MTTTDGDLTDGKANFDDIYDRNDPRAYYGELGRFDYEIPQQGQEVFSALLQSCANGPVQDANVLDLCCSYGINAALMTCDLTLDDLMKRYIGDDLVGLSADEVRDSDTDFYQRNRRPDAPTVAGLDISANAVGYASDVGLLQPGLVQNLEEEDPDAAVASVMADVDLVTVTGGVGYIGARTFARLFDLADPTDPPWLAAFVLRRYSYSDIADALSERGMVTQRLSGRTFPQRRFASDEERDFTVRHLSEAGIDMRNREADGHFHTDLYLTRPAADAAEQSVDDLLGDLVTGVRGPGW